MGCLSCGGVVRRTFGDILKENDGVGPGFDLLRLLLALAILLAHLAPIGGTRGLVPSIIDAVMSLFGHVPVMSSSASVTAAATGSATIPDMGVAGAGLSKPILRSYVPMFFALSGFLVAGSAFRTKRVLPLPSATLLSNISSTVRRGRAVGHHHRDGLHVAAVARLFFFARILDLFREHPRHRADGPAGRHLLWKRKKQTR